MKKSDQPKTFTMSTADVYNRNDIENRHVRQTILSRLHAAHKDSSDAQRLDFFHTCINMGAISQCDSIGGVPLYAINLTHTKIYKVGSIEK